LADVEIAKDLKLLIYANQLPNKDKIMHPEDIMKYLDLKSITQPW
jgi:DNA polymerase III psi subunit